TQVDPNVWVQAPLTGQFRGRPRHMEIAQGIVRPVGVAPEPVDLALVWGVDHAILAEDPAVEQRLSDRDRIAGQGAVAIDPGPCDPIEPLRQVAAADQDPGRSPLDDLHGLSGVSEGVLGRFVTVTLDEEKNLPVEQARLVEGHDAVAVGHVANLVDGLEFHQGYAAPGLLIDDLDAEDAGSRWWWDAVGRPSGLVGLVRRHQAADRQGYHH